jgi:two-component system, OmpR family, KDP operon response regulator KdpE
VTRVLVIDDEPSILRALRINLTARNYEVTTASDGASGLAAVARERPDVLILDMGLPDMDGTDVIHGVRGWSSTPIIVLSVWGAESQKVAALDAGADDYVTKPFGMDELLARLRAAVRRAAPAPDEPVVATPDFTVDLASKRVTRGGGAAAADSATSGPHDGTAAADGPASGPHDGTAAADGPASGPHDGTAHGSPVATAGADIRLTPTEWQLLEVLVRASGRLVTQRQLLQEVWGPQYESESNYLRVYIAQLRRKLEPEPSRPRYLLTEPGMGYRFQA